MSGFSRLFSMSNKNVKFIMPSDRVLKKNSLKLQMTSFALSSSTNRRAARLVKLRGGTWAV